MNTLPLAQDLWHGIGGHFDSLSQIICEFIDNAISNFEANKVKNRSINIAIGKPNNRTLKVLIEDTGTGMRNLEATLRLGDRSIKETPLNEHGFGLKHALASANPNNDSWTIYTRTINDFNKNKYTIINAPYSFNIETHDVDNNTKSWPGDFNGSGTIVEFQCSETLYNTLQKGIRGFAGFERCLDYLREELGYIYAGVIEKGKATINITSTDYSKPVEAIRPDWEGFYDPKPSSTEVDLGSGKVTIEYKFGEMNESQHVKYYKRNMSTSGVEIRINGRLLIANLFKEIWGIEPHPSFNHFLATLNLISLDSDKLPKTRTPEFNLEVQRREQLLRLVF